MVKVTKVGNSVKITIPKAIWTHLKLKVGDMVALSVTDDNMIVRKAK